MKNRVRLLTLSALLCALMIVSTLWLKFPVPGTNLMFTLQVFVVLLTGFVLPPNYCFLTLGTYLLLGLLGLPVFSAISGPAVLATPSFGFLMSFPFAAASVSILSKRLSHRKWGAIAASVAGVFISYAFALPYIAVLKAVYFDAPIPLQTLLNAYCLAFLPLDFVKALLAAFFSKKIEKPLRLFGLR